MEQGRSAGCTEGAGTNQISIQRAKVLRGICSERTWRLVREQTQEEKGTWWGTGGLCCIGLNGMFEFWKGKQLEDAY